jgi:hypothetical protein
MPSPKLEALRTNRVFRPPIAKPDVKAKESPMVSFADLVRMLAEGIADAQASLDQTSAEMAAVLAQTKVPVIPRVTETIDEDGNISYEHAEAVEVSLLDLGIDPTFYQFSEAKVEVTMDIQILETEKETGTEKKSFGLFAGTSDLRFERKMNRKVDVSSKLSATLVPVPKPIRIDPVRTTVTPEPE